MRDLDDVFHALSRSPFRMRMTPMRGHPVFVAQHATATCCRSCLAKWHGIPAGKVLDQTETSHVLAAIERWLRANATSTDG